MSARKYKFLIVDDHQLFRQGVEKIIAHAFPNAKLAEAGNSAEAYALAVHHAWDLLIIDINMPGRSGLDLIKDIKMTNKDMPILVLSMYEESHMALRALKSGASGYLSKNKAANELILAINKILEGKQYISEEVTELLISVYRSEKNENIIDELSDREYFVMLRLGAGESVTDISKALSLSVKTVSTYRHRLMKKLKLENMSQLYSFIHENKLEKQYILPF